MQNTLEITTASNYVFIHPIPSLSHEDSIYVHITPNYLMSGSLSGYTLFNLGYYGQLHNECKATPTLVAMRLLGI